MKTEMAQWFDSASKSLPVLRQQFTTQVVSWVFSKADRWSYENKQREENDSDILPGREGAACACGFDAADRPIFFQHFYPKQVIDEYGIADSDIHIEEFITHNGDTLEIASFVRAHLQSVSRLRYENQLLIEDEIFIDGHYQRNLRHYEGRRIRLQQSYSEHGVLFYESAFGPNGEQTCFRVRRDGTRFQLYQPLPKGITVKSLKETVRNRLVAVIPQLVASAGITEPIYCVALVYDDEGNDALPPSIGIGLASERKRWRQEHGKRAPELIWNPAEFHHHGKSHTQLSDEALEEACDYLNGKWTEGGSSAPAAKLLVEATIELNRADWPASVQRTDDFLVYAIGLEGSGLRKNLKAVLGAEKLAAFKSAGFL